MPPMSNKNMKDADRKLEMKGGNIATFVQIPS